jgi:hypothetical protein
LNWRIIEASTIEVEGDPMLHLPRTDTRNRKRWIASIDIRPKARP